MTHLLLDIGNTRSKAAIMGNGNVTDVHYAESAKALNLTDLVEKHDVDAAIACVVGTPVVFEELLPPGLPFHQLSCHSRLPFRLDYATPQSLGMDRVAAIAGAREMAPGSPLMVIDAGTCITIDLLDDNDCYRGGAILPGLGMRFRALHEFTAALPLVTLDDAVVENSNSSLPAVGRSTRQSIYMGVAQAAIYEVQGFRNEYLCQYPQLKCFLTGGDADFFAEQLFFPKFATHDLMFIGLDKILSMNI